MIKLGSRSNTRKNRMRKLNHITVLQGSRRMEEKSDSSCPYSYKKAVLLMFIVALFVISAFLIYNYSYRTSYSPSRTSSVNPSAPPAPPEYSTPPAPPEYSTPPEDSKPPSYHSLYPSAPVPDKYPHHSQFGY
ncbi:hypothetical protein EHEL_111645 [Encephalitozoon hellem ATCC 50504]|uniref:Uncharacterized protein n=1 Tax=Encephalitozoon hellem TaxID=27973 RepID=A0A9Q9CC02_ENCHE|nr:uncharacterized protein EHEL_111645 [Encephalitozoon hellem ATCC 50504]AHL28980.1 hypothetical protein EHEL_111645 [Encephalitozoon hellem ATCC 50504]UTX44447.1 hypothetical protein GPU96_11g22510 [Encephalitozoon hellem]